MTMLAEKQRVTLVDVRSGKQFTQFQIPGSINVPLFAVKTKTFLKHTPIILLDEGYQPATLNAACKQLQQTGFETSFLFGGLAAWRTQGGLLTGDIIAQKTASLVPPQAFFQEQDAAYWLIIDASSANTQSLFLQAVHLPDASDPEQSLRNLGATLANQETRTWQMIIIITEYGEGYSFLDQGLDPTSLPPIFFLRGGWQAYRQFMNMQTTIRQQSHVTQTEGGACARCNSTTN